MATNKMSIPEVRTRMLELADELNCEELKMLAGQLYRRSPVRRAPRVSNPCTPRIAQDIREYAAQHPKMPLDRIASQFGVNPGRVSEAMNGER